MRRRDGLALLVALPVLWGCGESPTRAAKVYRRVAAVATERVAFVETPAKLDSVYECLLSGRAGRLNLEAGPRLKERQRIVFNQPQSLLIRASDVGSVRVIAVYKRPDRQLSVNHLSVINACAA